MRSDWTREEVEEIYFRPLLALISEASAIHRTHHDFTKMKKAALLSVKTGACPEDCAYCPQSAHYNTGLRKESLMNLKDVVESALAAKQSGAARFCLGAAWRELKPGDEFERVLDMVREVSGMGLEVCCTMGMLKEEQAKALKKAGIHAYNHNLDSGEEFYSRIITTREYADRLNTIRVLQQEGIRVCSGGIIGMGEADADRISLLHSLCTLDPHPESVPLNVLIPIPGTPLQSSPAPSSFELVRMVASARMLMPESFIRLSAGRSAMSDETQALCFLAGANSIFSGEKLLTAENASINRDEMLLKSLGLNG